jgi:Zn-dependent protease with chaperone function
MKFFQHQERARRSTRWLILLLGLALICIILAIYFVALGVVAVIGARHPEFHRAVIVAGAPWWWQPNILLGAAAGTLAVVGCGSLYKVWALGSGGAAVAESLGGRLVKSDTTNADERRLLNVIEEMSIASGVPMPLVFVLDEEEGVNAFAAGYAPHDAAIAVTRGTMQLLNRDELQGVIAHEFSHVLSGDMRLNIRLIGLVYGILVIAIIGMGIIRNAGRGSSRRGKGVVGALLIGAALAIIGYVGVFFGRIIKAAISRQREFLADASAVDFTRNPDGIAGALKKIAGYARGSSIRSAEGEAVSHMLFGDWRLKAFQAGGFLSTHPPLAERIRRIDPSFDGSFARVEAMPTLASSDEERWAAGPAVAGLTGAKRVRVDAGDVLRLVGSPEPAHLLYGAALIASLPEELEQASRNLTRSVCLVYALLLNEDEETRQRQVSLLRQGIGEDLTKEVLRLSEFRRELNPSARLPLLDLAMPALRQLSEAQYPVFLRHVQILAGADRETTIFEFALYKVLFHRLRASREKEARRTPRCSAFTPLQADCMVVLSALARAGHQDEDAVLRAFKAGVTQLPSGPERFDRPLPAESCSFTALGLALDKLTLAAPIIKQRVIDAFARCVLIDGEVTIEEAELLRAVACCLDCPLPPFLPTTTPEESETTAA